MCKFIPRKMKLAKMQAMYLIIQSGCDIHTQLLGRIDVYQPYEDYETSYSTNLRRIIKRIY